MIGADLNEKYETLVAEIARLAAAMEHFEFPKSDQQPSPAYRVWEPFVNWNGGTTDANGNATVSVGTCEHGWEALVHRISVTVQGASSAATVEAYRGGAADTQLVDYASAMFGNSPSRVVGGYKSGLYTSEQSITIVVAGAVASQGVAVRVEGRRRQIQAGLGE